MTTLLLVRHGQSEWNREGRIQGQEDSPLTQIGKDQANRIGKYLATVLSPDQVKQLRLYTSPMGRAQETTSIIARALDYDIDSIHVEQRLNDYDQGEITGTPGWDVVAERFPELARLRLEDPLSYHPVGGESGLEFRARLSDFLDELDEFDGAAYNKPVINLLVSHGIVNKYIRSIRRNITGAGIIALEEGQDMIFRLDDADETIINCE